MAKHKEYDKKHTEYIFKEKKLVSIQTDVLQKKKTWRDANGREEDAVKKEQGSLHRRQQQNEQMSWKCLAQTAAAAD